MKRGSLDELVADDHLSHIHIPFSYLIYHQREKRRNPIHLSLFCRSGFQTGWTGSQTGPSGVRIGNPDSNRVLRFTHSESI